MKKTFSLVLLLLIVSACSSSEEGIEVNHNGELIRIYPAEDQNSDTELTDPVTGHLYELNSEDGVFYFSNPSQ